MDFLRKSVSALEVFPLLTDEKYAFQNSIYLKSWQLKNLSTIR